MVHEHVAAMATGMEGRAALVGSLVILAAGIVVLAVAFVAVRSLQRARAATLGTAQQQLRESEERLRFALEATSEIVWDWDLVCDSIYHPRWAQTYGYPEEATPRSGKELMPFIHPDDAPAFGAQLNELLDGKRKTIDIEHRVRAGSGEWRWMHGKARIVGRNERGEPIRIIGTCADVTERKKMVSRLQFADRMASVGTLAAGVAHEINNPLAYVIGNLGFAIEALAEASELAASGRWSTSSLMPVLDECRRALKEAEDGATRVRGIVRDLKVFSRSDEDQRGPVDVRRVVESALNLASNELRHRARVVTRLSDVPLVLANEARLTQVFLNLLVNAAQAIREGAVEENEIEVEVRRGDLGHVVVEVRDSGCGIKPEDRARIFDPFFTTKPAGIGTGLGLAICHGIVDALGGEIDVESEVGKGSTFRVLLPATQERPAAAGAVPEPAAASRRGRILVVDDEPLFCRTVERVLKMDHDVVALGDAREALARIQAGETFDVVLTDLVMPGMSGMELYAAVERAAPALAERILFVTGGAFTPDATAFVAERPDRVLEKPLTADAIRAAVAGAVERVHDKADRVA